MRNKRVHYLHKLTAVFILGVFYSLLITMVIIGIISFTLIKLDIIEINYATGHNIILDLLSLVILSLLIGTFVSGITCRIIIRPINKLVDGLDLLSDGEYNTRINLGENKVFKSLSNSFNSLANELQNTEMLRSDFVNNFSHEFKTPIVSIRGFARLLQKDDISRDKQKEYLNIIVDESTRLAVMATKVLELTKLENQMILTDVSKYNLSEQIRKAIVLLESSWTKKNININIDFDEHYIYANEEMLEHVWINLIENSIKFSPNYSEVGINIRENDDFVIVTIRNNGELIQQEETSKVFHKFYQGDKSHAMEGNGIGLAIVKKIIDLHNGEVTVKVVGNENVFIIKLPKNIKHL